MKNAKTLISLVALFACLATSCSTGGSSSKSETTSSSGATSSSTSAIDDEKIKEYMNGWKSKSQENHLYVHYYRLNPSKEEYNQFDVWSWPYKPKPGEGYRFDWMGRTTSSDRLTATGDATIDTFGYATVDIDLTKTYDGGWNDSAKTMGGKPTDYYKLDKSGLDEQVGVQFVISSTRLSRDPTKQFWENDGGNIYLTLEDFELEDTKSFHAFFVQEDCQHPTAVPKKAQDIVDPFKDDHGENVTYGDSKYKNADWTDKAIKATSSKFSNIGVGYQIMVSSFADSDGDGSGDIYGIEQKLDYLKNLGVQALWLTPIQSSDSYHGYDISNYLTVDKKFGSKVSPASVAAGEVSSATALADYKSLIDKAHEKGMVVVMDLVLNHTSTTNDWFINSAQLNKELRGYFQWGNNEKDPTHINEGKYWYKYGTHCYSYYAKFGSSMPELNYAYKSTREAVEDVALNWCEFGVDGFRMDAVKHIFLRDEIDIDDNNDTYVMDVSDTGDYSSNLTKNLNFWKELNHVVKSQYPDCFFVGENFDGSAYHVAPYYEGFDSLFDFYSYFNLTSLAARAYKNGNSGPYTGSASQWIGAKSDAGEYKQTQYAFSKAEDMYNPNKDGGKGSGLYGNTKSVKYDSVSTSVNKDGKVHWNINDVLFTNNRYRSNGGVPTDQNGYSAINGCFTSNHDIARCINRVVGSNFDLNGLTEQGDVSTGNYKTMNELATCVEIAELMMPGLTWIYYGDELGMTGNLEGKKSTDGYADLVYRQPMKWTSDGKVGDGSFTCGYDITGSGTGVKLDNVNKTSTVAPASSQTGDSKSHYSVLKTFAALKGSTPALIKGNFVPYGWDDSEFVLNFGRKLNGKTYNVTVNFGNSACACKMSGVVKASYNGATVNNLPARSALVIEVA